MAQHATLLVTEEPGTVRAVTAALQSNGQLAQENVVANLTDLGARLSAHPAASVLVDIDTQPGRTLGMLDSLVRRFPDTRFIVLAREMEPRLMLEAMQAGARHFITKAEVPNSLCDVIRRLTRTGAPSAAQIISIFSAAGGCESTTLAVNLACELRSSTNRPTMLVDLDYAYGGVSAYLGLEGTYGVMDLQERSGSIDPELISTSAVAFGENLKVVVSSAPSRLGMTGGYSRLKDTIQACAFSSAIVVVDAPRLSPDVAAELASVSTINLLLLQLNVKDVRATRSMLGAMRARGVAAESFKLLVNRYRKRSSPLSIEEARRALHDAEMDCLSNDFQAASESINFGQPLEKSAPRSALRKDIQQLAARLLAAVVPVEGAQP